MCQTYPTYLDGLWQWKQEANGAASIVSRVARAVSGHGWYLAIAADVWRLDRSLRSFLADIYEGIEKPKPRAKGAEPATDEVVLELAESFRSLYRDIDRLHSLAKRAGLTNTTLTGAAFNSVRLRAEEVLDLAETIEMLVKGNTRAIFERALEERQSGEVYSLDQIGR